MKFQKLFGIVEHHSKHEAALPYIRPKEKKQVNLVGVKV